MTEPTASLSLEDVQRLIADKSADARIALVEKLVRTAETGLLSAQEQAIAGDVLRRLAVDAAQQVREAVAWQIYNSPLLSDEVARTLALDVISVSFPLLRHSAALGDALLLEIIGQDDAAKQFAIAARSNLSETVSAALAEVGNLAVVATLAGNASASLDDATLERLADRYAHIPLVAEPLAGRAVLPASVVERLVAAASTMIRDMLVERYRLSPFIAGGFTAHARDSATLALLRPLQHEGMSAEALAVHLNSRGRLGIAMLLRSFCAGDFEFFGVALATKSRVVRRNTKALLEDMTGEGLRALLEHAHIPKRLFQPFLLAHQVAQELGYRGGDPGREAFQTAVLARLYLQCGQSEDRDMDDLLLQLFDQKPDAMVEQAMDEAGMPFMPLRGPVPGGAAH